MSRPFVKWAGGKSQSLKDIYKYLPKSFGSYYEPFVGGGALFFSLRPATAFLSDSNWELMTAYKVVKDDVETLITLLSEMVNDKDYFETVRRMNPKEMTDAQVAARMIYLNKTCYNGLYRVNSKNEFNAPFGNYKNPAILDKSLLRSCSKFLANANLQATYFENVFDNAKENDLVYFDPPYLQLKDSSFVNYTKSGFFVEDHERLASTFDELVGKGVKCLLSNSDTTWARERFAKYNVVEIQSRRSINSKGDGRGMISELLIVS